MYAALREPIIAVSLLIILGHAPREALWPVALLVVAALAVPADFAALVLPDAAVSTWIEMTALAVGAALGWVFSGERLH